MNEFKKYHPVANPDSHIFINTDMVSRVEPADDGSSTDIYIFAQEKPVSVVGDVSEDYFKED